MPLRALFIGLVLAGIHIKPARGDDRKPGPLLAPPPVFVATVTPNSGPTSGGTRVTIQGKESVPANSTVSFGFETGVVEQISGGTIIVTTPSNLPGAAAIVLHRADGGIMRISGGPFTYEGNVPQTYERVLLPLFVPPVSGAFGSLFHTELRLSQKDLGETLVFGVRPRGLESHRPDYVNEPLLLVYTGGTSPEFDYDGTPGRFFYVKAGAVESFGANLRVRDVTRSALNFGTEIPVVRSREFTSGTILLQGVPTDPRFRNTLRIYSDRAAIATATVQGVAEETIQLRGAGTIFEPAFASVPISLGSNGSGQETVNVLVQARGTPIWALISATNNETQMITTITPKP